MRPILKPLRSAFLTGLFILLPGWLAVLLFAQLLVHLKVIVRPVTLAMPEGINHPAVWAVILFILICLAIGLLFHTAIGKVTGNLIESHLLNKIPGYSPMRAIARQMSDLKSSEDFQPVLIEVEDGCLAPAFLVERHAESFVTVFVPSAPTPMAGSIFIMPAARVHPLGVPPTRVFKCIARWGTGSGELVAAMPKGFFDA